MSITPSNTIRVLHVDDDREFLDLTKSFLERENDAITVETATTVSEGRERVDDGDFDCVISDYDMPDMTGIEFLETVRETHPDLPFILFTGKGSEEVASDAISAGVTDYLQKDPGTDQYAVLANRVTNAVGHDRSRRLVERSKRRLREIVDAIPDLLYVVDADGRYLLANERVAEFHESTVADIEGELVENVLADAAASSFREHVRDAFDAEGIQRYPAVELDGPDGTRVFEPRLRPYEFGDERAVLGIAADVTEREANADALERTNTLLSRLFDTLPVGVLAENEDRTVLAANQQLVDLFDFDTDASALVGANCDRLADDASDIFADPDSFTARIGSIVADREPVRDEELALADGRTYTRSYQPVDFGDDSGHLWVYRDVTDRAEHESRLEALNETTRALLSADTREEVARLGVDAAADVLCLEANAVHLHDPDRNMLVPVASTDTLHQLIGGPPEFTPGNSIAWRVFDSGNPVALDDVHADPDVYNADTPMRSELIVPIGDAGVLVAGSPTSAAFDHEDRVLGELLAGNIATALEQVERTAELEERERELTQQNERLEEFASVVSHDLRSPLSVANGRVELAREETGNPHLDDAVSALDRMDDLIEDLLLIARDGDEPRLEPVDLAALAETCWGHIETGDATLVTDTTRTIRADRGRLQQLLENLLRNCVEHTDPDVTVTVGHLDDGIFVADDGPGIPEDRRDAVFELGHSTSNTGAGLGLRIVQRVADAHGWTVGVTESEPGGARFEVRGVEFA